MVLIPSSLRLVERLCDVVVVLCDVAIQVDSDVGVVFLLPVLFVSLVEICYIKAVCNDHDVSGFDSLVKEVVINFSVKFSQGSYPGFHMIRL